jgi:FKBP-type peptidyl-prolyl cis-trans isomerase SlyD
MKISKEKVVSIHYTLKDKTGEVLDSSDGQTPLAYIQGLGNIIPGLEKALDGKQVGEKLNVVIPPEDAYGIRKESFVKTIPLSEFENQSDIKVGAQFRVETSQETHIATVINVENENVTIDLNHPLADETLHFDVEVMDIREATQEELSHGHVHGAGGHEH